MAPGALESVSTSALTIYPCQIRVHLTLTVLNSNFLQLGKRSGGRPQRTVYPRWLPVKLWYTLWHRAVSLRHHGFLVFSAVSIFQFCR